MNTRSQKYAVNQYHIEIVLAWVLSGEIAIPEIQRPFVWDATDVRDLMDSLYQGFPVGYLIAWKNPNVRLKDGTHSEGKKVLIDGQQRVTALSAAILGHQIVDQEYRRVRIKIAFNPIKEQFEVQNPAILKDSTWLPDIPSYPLPAPMLECVWTKAGYWCGEIDATNKTCPPDFECAFQKAIEDAHMQDKFSDIAEDYFNSHDTEISDALLRKLNEGYSKFSAKAKSPRQLYKAQLLVMIEEHNDLIGDVMRQLCRDVFKKTSEQCVDFIEPLVLQALSQALSPKTIATDLPGIHIFSTLLAAISWDKKRPFAAHDIHDIMHAHSALPDHNYVFVEGPFGHLLVAGPARLADSYAAKVFSKETDVIRALEIIGAHPGLMAAPAYSQGTFS